VSWDDKNSLASGHNRRQKIGLLLQTRNQTEVLSVENTTLSISKVSKASQLKYQKHVDYLGIYWEVLQYLREND
jgi:hypothetical protein